MTSCNSTITSSDPPFQAQHIANEVGKAVRMTTIVATADAATDEGIAAAADVPEVLVQSLLQCVICCNIDFCLKRMA